MKSIMQEASSVMKAVEKGWETAGKPKEFLIKIFEEPKKNFIGLTVQSAKVGIFFDEKFSAFQDAEKDKNIPAKKNEYIRRPLPKKEAYTKPELRSEPKEIKTHEPAATNFAKTDQTAIAKEKKIIWTDDMISLAQEWTSEVLKLINMTTVDFTTKASHYQLLIQFNKPLSPQSEREQQLLRNLSLLLIQTLRHKLKRPLRGFKIIMAQGS